MHKQIDYSFPYPSRRPLVCAENVVATSQPLAAQAGLHMLQQGGNAVDAALAAAIAATVVEPTGCGLGGDAFALLWDGQAMQCLNGSGPSPQAWTPEVFSHLQRMPSRGWLSVTVPGVVASWEALSQKYGSLPFSALFQPAITYARQGFLVSPTIAELWQKIIPKYADQPGFADYFLPQGRAPRAGEQFVNPDLADSLALIAKEGSAVFYEGILADKMLAHSDQHGGLLRKTDLANYQPEWLHSIVQGFAGYEVHQVPPNTQGIAVLIALGILKNFELESYDPDSPAFIHLCIEAMKLAFADTAAYVADPAFTDFDSKALLSAEYLAYRASLIDPQQANEYTAGAPNAGGTVYVCAADSRGQMVSFIQSNYEGFGSGIVVPDTGISMQNRGMGFSLEQGHPNYIDSGKRPFHTIIPGFVTQDNQPELAFGVMGGPMQAQGHVQMVLRVCTFNQNPQTAIDAPRWQFQHGKRVLVEASMSEQVVRTLKSLGHDIHRDEGEAVFSFGGAQLIQRVAGGYIAGSDGRKDGLAVGF